MGDYICDCVEHNKESVLIAGCGHTDDANLIGNHLHQGAYCVDIDNPDEFMDMRGVKLNSDASDLSATVKPHWQETKADACPDITSRFPLPGNKFNTVVLERIWSKPLGQPFTLHNSAKLLIEGGLLIIDLHDTYILDQYQLRNEQYLVNQVFASNQSRSNFTFQHNFSTFGFYDRKTKADEIAESLNGMTCHDKVESQLKRFDYDLKKRPKMRDMYDGIIDYLNQWGFENVIYINVRVQPYTFDLSSPNIAGRKGNFIIATKSVITSKLMPEWLKSINKFFNKK